MYVDTARRSGGPLADSVTSWWFMEERLLVEYNLRSFTTILFFWFFFTSTCLFGTYLSYGSFLPGDGLGMIFFAEVGNTTAKTSFNSSNHGDITSLDSDHRRSPCVK